jgi:hypothetical protein
LLDPDAIERIEWLPRLRRKDAHEEITKILKEHAISSIKIEAFVKNAIELNILVEYYGDLEGCENFNSGLRARSQETRKKYGWPERLTDFEPESLFKLAFRGMPPSSKEEAIQRARDFLNAFSGQITDTDKDFAHAAFILRIIVKEGDLFRAAD